MEDLDGRQRKKIMFLPTSRAMLHNDYKFKCLPKWIWLWLCPILVAGCGFILQNFQLHYATYYYVHTMTQIDLQRGPTANSGHDVGQKIPLSIGETAKNVSFGSVDDPVSVILGYEKTDIGFLDILAVAIPAVFVVTSLLLDNPYTFARAMFCFAFMEVLKGLVDWITVVPDSSGWQVCKTRLAASPTYTVEWYAQEHSLWEMIQSELYAPTGRFCSDMMVSGHTQAVTVFGLGLFESVTVVANTVGWSIWTRRMAEYLVAGVVIFQQCCEVYFVLKSRFHYSSDILMAIVVSYLVYTSAIMSELALWHLQQGHAPKKHHEKRESAIRIEKELRDTLSDDGCCGSGQLIKKWLNRDLKEDHLGNRWLWMVQPRLIQLGCCCTPKAQVYMMNQHDLMHIFHTVDRLMEGIQKVKNRQLKEDPNRKIVFKDLENVFKDLEEELKDFKMNKTIKEMIWQGWALPEDALVSLMEEYKGSEHTTLEWCVEKEVENGDYKAPNQQPLLP